jgi:hypothetical protein
VNVNADWAIGTYVDEHGRRVPWPISHDEMSRDVGAATNVLSEIGVAGHGVLWCSMLAEAGQYWPYVCGTVLAGGRGSCADATRGEAARVDMFLRSLEYAAVFGVTDAILDGLDERGRPYAEVFAGVRLVGAHPGAYERLQRAGVAATRFACCGPAVAIGREPGWPAQVAGDEWELSEAGGRICITARAPRAHLFACTPTAIRGTLDGGGVTW